MDTTTRPTVFETTGTTTARPADVAAITAVIADFERAFNTNDPDLGVEHFAADAGATTALGRIGRGWDALLAAHQVGYAGPLADQFAEYEVTSVDFLGADVALAHKRAWPTDADRTRLQEEPAMVALYVFVRVDDRWWIASRSNTLVVG